MLLEKDFVMQGGVRNYLGKTEEVTAPKFWQSSKNSPKTELAYITEEEKGLLADANLHGSLKNGKPNIGASGLLSYDGFGSTDPGQNRAGVDVSRDMDRGRDERQDTRSSGGGQVSAYQGITDTTYNTARDNNVLEEPTFTGEVQDTTNLADPPKGKLETFFDDVKEFFAGGGIVGNVAKGVVDFIAPISGAIQKKAIKYSLNKKLEKIYKDNPDFEDYESEGEIPGLIGVDVRDLQRDLRGLEDGTFTQKDYTAKYGSGDGTNPLDASFNPATLRDDERSELETIFAPELAYAIGNTTPQNSMVNEYFANINNNNLGINSAYMDTYNKAKSDMAAKLQLTNNTQQYGYTPYPYQNNSMTMTSANPFFDELNNQGLI